MSSPVPQEVIDAHIREFVADAESHFAEKGFNSSFLERAGGHLADAIRQYPDALAMGPEEARNILQGIYKVLIKGDQINQDALNALVRERSGIALQGEEELGKAVSAATERKIGPLVAHSGRIGAAVGTGTVIAACLWPNNKTQEAPQADGTMQTKHTWSRMKVTAIAVGSIISAALLAHSAHGWAKKVFSEAEKVATHSV